MRLVHIYGFLFLFFTFVTTTAFLWVHDYHSTKDSDKLFVVCTTTIIADAVHCVGGSYVHVECLMGPGVDPHTYRAREGDVHRMAKADVIFYNGLHLEGRMQNLMVALERSIKTVAVTDGLDRSYLRSLCDEIYDPHVWHDVFLWRYCVQYIAQQLSLLDAKNADYYKENASLYDAELKQLDAYCRERIAQLPQDRRVVVTAHDAFYYCAQRYSFSVRGLQGMSTEAEVTMHDIEQAVSLIVEYKIPSIFVESSVSPRAIRAVQEGVAAYGFCVALGDELYSDSLGNNLSDGATYAGMIRHNIDAIVTGLSH